MARIRSLKPECFKDEDLATLPYEGRILYMGLWCFSDKEGRLEYRPKYLKAEIFPYDNINIEKFINLLSDPKIPDRPEKVFIRIYTVKDRKYIDIPEFLKHQSPHHTEKDSELPSINELLTVNESLIKGKGGDRYESLSLSESLSKSIANKKYNDEFLQFWNLYPNKKEKSEAFKKWNRLNGTRPPIEKILKAVQDQIDWRKNVKPGEFRPEWKHPSTWLNKGCWEDELKTENKSTPKTFKDDFTNCVQCGHRRLKSDVDEKGICIGRCDHATAAL